MGFGSWLGFGALGLQFRLYGVQVRGRSIVVVPVLLLGLVGI